MKKIRNVNAVRGAGGGGGGGSSGGAEAPDSLRSNQIARYIDALCEGEIRGLVDGKKSIYINGTPLENSDGSQNFGGIDLQWRNGTLTQTAMDGFSQTEIENYVGTEVKKAQPITRTLNNPTCKEVRVTVAVPGLISYDVNGNINGSSVSFQIAIQNNGGGFVPMVTDTISGKTNSKYKRAYRLALPGSGPWDIRVTRITNDSTSSKVQNSLFFDAFTGIVPSVVAYINTAVVGVALNAQQFAGVPERGYEIYGRIIQVPTNYDPVSRTYSGAWDGNFKMAWSDNPAWCFYDMLTQPRFGLGDFVDASTVDKWSLYTIAKYCDVLVPDGMGGTEPRFSCNLVLQSREDAYKVIQNMASIFRGIAYWGAAGVIAVQDRPGDVAAVYTNANVIDGTFTYQGSSTNVRHTVALVAWNDPADGYKQSVEYVQDDELIEKYGIIQTEVTAFGCTSRAQAYRYGRWALMTERIETETVSFACGFDGLETGTGSGLYPGAVIQTSDILRAGKRMGGRLKDGNTTTVLQLDAPKTLVAGKQYRVLVSMPEGKPVERAVINVGGEVSTLTLASALPYQPTVDAVIALIESDSVELETWRVLGVVETDTGTLECTAIKHNPSKYDSVELGWNLDEPSISTISARPNAPTGLQCMLAQRTLDDAPSSLTGTLSWEGDAAKFRVRYRFEQEGWINVETAEHSIDIQNMQVGQYEFAVTAVSALGITSMQATLVYAVTPQPIVLPSITGLAMEGAYVTETAKFKWDRVAGATGYEVKIEAGGQVRRTLAVGDALRFDYKSADMRVDGGPWRSYTFSVRAVGKWGSASPWASLTPSNPQVAPLQGIKIESGIKSGFFSCASPVEDDFAGIIIWLSTDPACSPVPVNQVYEGQDTFVTLSHLADGTPLAGGTTYYLRAAGYDTFGMDSLNVSSSVACSPAIGAITETEIGPGAIKTPHLAANSVVAEHVVLHTLTGDHLQVGSVSLNALQSGTGGGNLLPNAAFAATYVGSDGYRKPDAWVEEYFPTPGTWSAVSYHPDYKPEGVEYLAVYRPNGGTAGAYKRTQKISVVGGAWYELSGWTCAINCTWALCAIFFDADGNLVGTTPYLTCSGGAVSKSLSSYLRVFGVGQAPAGAVSAQISIEMGAPTGASYEMAFLLQPYFGVANGPNQSQPSPWSPSGVGTQIHGGVLKTNSVTADRMAVTSLSAITGNMGYLTAGEVHGGCFHSGGFSSAYAWPPAGQRGFHLGPEGLRMGNANDGHWVQIDASGQNFTMPGLRMQNGTLYVDQLEVIGAANIKSNNICISAMAESPGTSTLSVTVSLPKTAVYFISAIRKVSPGANNSYNNYFWIKVNGNMVASATYDDRTSLEKNIVLGAGTHTITAESGVFWGETGSSYVVSLSTIGIIQ